MLKSKSSLWSVGAGALCVVLLVATWFLLIAPRRSEAADLRDQTANRVRLNGQLELQIETLRKQNADLPREQAILAAIKLEMPEQRAQGALVHRLDEIAEDTGVELTSYSQGTTAQLGAVGGAAAAKLPAGIQVFTVPTSLVFDGDYFSAARFIKKLQTELTRSFLVTAIDVKPLAGHADGDVVITLTGSLFVLHTGATAVGSPVATATPAPTGAASASPSPTASVSPLATATPTTTP